MIRDVHAGRIFVGNARDARDASLIYTHEIAAVVDLATEESPPQLPRELMVLRIPLIDGAGNAAVALRLAVDAVGLLVRQQVPTLVACSAGMSRSPAIVAAALAMVLRRRPEDTLAMITREGPHDVSPGLWGDLLVTIQGLPSAD